MFSANAADKALEELEKETRKKLAAHYQEWLDIAFHISSDTEKKIFLNLANDKDRDAFINLFWRMRDPSPATKENEFRDEHIKRFQYANRHFKYHGARPGWQTDMGMIHIILGKPSSIERFISDEIVVSSEIWSYYGKEYPNLPNSFDIVFYQPNNIGEYKLYNPVSDGPYRLLLKNLTVAAISADNYEEIYGQIYEKHPTLANASLSLIPNEPLQGYSPSLGSNVLLNKVATVPFEKINTRYATDFANFQGMVNVNDTSRYIDCDSEVHVIRHEQNNEYFVHFVLLPKTLSIDYLDEKKSYFFNFKITVNLKQKNESVFTYTKDFPFYSEENAELVKQKYAQGVLISDSFPVIPGDFSVMVLVQNPVFGEFFYFEKTLKIQAKEQNLPAISGPFVTYNAEQNQRQVYLPFKFSQYEITVNPLKEFGYRDPLILFFRIDRNSFSETLAATVEVCDLFDQTKPITHQELKIPHEDKHYYYCQPNSDLKPGNYLAKVVVAADKKVVLKAASTEFTISPNQTVSRPNPAFRITPMENQFMVYHALAMQSLNTRQPQQADTYFKKSLALKPDALEVVKDYAKLLFTVKSYREILQLSAVFKDNPQASFDYFALQGKAYFFLQEYAQAIKLLQQANAIYDSDITVLNALGFCYLQTNNRSEAQKVLSASLKLNPEQTQVRAVVEKLQQNR
jgi:GWxTD domain-containing protein